MLTDDNTNPRSQPTRKNILNAMRWLVEDARANDALFFHCSWAQMPNVLNDNVDFAADSGHGGKTRDMDGDELDGWDEGDVVRLSISVASLSRDGSYLPCRLPENGNHY